MSYTRSSLHTALVSLTLEQKKTLLITTSSPELPVLFPVLLNGNLIVHVVHAAPIRRSRCRRPSSSRLSPATATRGPVAAPVVRWVQFHRIGHLQRPHERHRPGGRGFPLDLRRRRLRPIAHADDLCGLLLVRIVSVADVDRRRRKRLRREHWDTTP